jgi:hypothetical protein
MRNIHTYSHGDCHGYNIMMGPNLKNQKFIDIADVCIDDYLKDYADLFAHICFSINLEPYSEEELAYYVPTSKLKPEGINIDNIYSENFRGLKIVSEIIFKEVNRQVQSRESNRGIKRFAFYLGKRLLFIASKSKSPLKSFVLYLQGIIILKKVVDCLVSMDVDKHHEEITVPPGSFMKIKI